MSFSIRTMRSEDVDGVMGLAATSVEAPVWTRLDYETVLPSATGEPLSAACWVAEAESGLAGFAIARWLRGEAAAEIEMLLVAGAQRRQGIATALVKACLQWGGHAGAAVVRLEVRASNTAARTLYAGLGFTAVGKRRAYYRSPVEDAEILEAPAGFPEGPFVAPGSPAPPAVGNR